MSHATRAAIVIACGLALASAVAIGQPPTALPPATAQALTLEDCAKLYGHLTLNEINGWWKKLPTTQAEAEQLQREVIEAMKKFDEANTLFSIGQPQKAKEAMLACSTGLLKVFNEDFPLLADLNGTYGVMLSQAGDVVGADVAFRKQRASMEKIFPVGKFPDGHPRLAIALTTIGTGQFALGRHAAAEALFRDALRMYRKVGPANPNGSDLTLLLGQLAAALFARKEFEEAESIAREALKRCEAHASAPGGSGEFRELLGKAKNTLASVLQARGKTAEADRLLAEATELAGPAQKGILLGNQAVIAMRSGDFALALVRSEEAVRAVEAAYPASQYPRGHPHLVQVLPVRGETLAASGDCAAAERVFARYLEMVRAIYPDDKCPDGHPELASALSVFGSLHLRLPSADNQGSAAQYFRDSLSISLGHTRAQAAYLSESAMLQQIDSAVTSVDGLLSVSRPFDSRDYWYLWETKAAVMRVLDYRRRLAVKSNDPAVKGILKQLTAVREELTTSALAPITNSATPSSSSDLTRRKEELESQLALAQGLPIPPRTGVGPTALSQVLPANAAFVDFWVYRRIVQDTANSGNSGRRFAPQYVAFVTTRDRDVVRVELGPTDAIDREVDAWLANIVRKVPDPILERQSAKKVADLVWKPLLDKLPSGLNALYICPDGSIGRLPFIALPDSTGEKVLLEQMKVIEVPHGPGLHARLSAPIPSTLTGPVLAIGDVEYGPGALPSLPGTDQEIRALGVAASESRIDPVIMLTKANATLKEVSARLETARVAHFATHAFANGVDRTPGSMPADVLIRNPLIGCKLALTGANSGIALEGEAIAGLRLNDLDLAVLSACNTARGVTFSGEGVYALRRAFHTAGCRAVVASLWSVDDLSTAALMTLFYHHLWVDRMAPEDALWNAQKELYQNPGNILAWAERKRGETAILLPEPPAVVRESLPRKWAGFQISMQK